MALKLQEWQNHLKKIIFILLNHLLASVFIKKFKSNLTRELVDTISTT